MSISAAATLPASASKTHRAPKYKRKKIANASTRNRTLSLRRPYLMAAIATRSICAAARFPALLPHHHPPHRHPPSLVPPRHWLPTSISVRWLRTRPTSRRTGSITPSRGPCRARLPFTCSCLAQSVSRYRSRVSMHFGHHLSACVCLCFSRHA